ncbi:probable lysosomal cobalamin transporter [Amphiura filiformis]|uniref:probable lysosomal cobalamin transporter n=1 Tax=Amphiura filiformis TaxID=82378 RepID=UPI003B219EC2
MEIPAVVPLATWISFCVVFVLALVYSFFYIRHYQSKYHSECSSSLAAIFSLTVTLMSIALVPIDVFVVSFMKDENGNYTQWAESNSTRQHLEDTLLYSYYALYACITVCFFMIIPFTLFYYEEGDEDTTTKQRICTALKYTSCFLFAAGVLLVIGAFVPLQSIPEDKNISNWQEFQFLVNELGDSKGETALYFLVGAITLLGTLGIIVYTSYGMSAWPIDNIRGFRNAKEELQEVQDEARANKEQRRHIRKKYRENRKKMSSRDKDRLDNLQDEEDLIQRKERHLVTIQKSLWYKCGVCWRPFQVVLGIALIPMGILVFISLILTSVDRFKHSLGAKTGYVLPERHYPNPIDMFLLLCQQVFPLDYIFFVGLVVYFLFASMAGIRRIGIWFCCVKMYKIRPHKTKPQGLLFLCLIMMCVILALNVMLYTLAPEYMTYGNQKYIPSNSTTPVQCTTAIKDCTMTVTTALLTKFVFQLWFFGACYYWANWVFLAFILIALLVALIKKRRSTIEGEVDASDTDDSDVEPLNL